MKTELYFFIVEADEFIRLVPLHIFGALCRGDMGLPEFANSRQRVLEALLNLDDSGVATKLNEIESLKATYWSFTAEGHIRSNPPYVAPAWTVQQAHIDAVNVEVKEYSGLANRAQGERNLQMMVTYFRTRPSRKCRSRHSTRNEDTRSIM